MINNFLIRHAKPGDREFIYSLSPRLANVAQLSWHSEEMMQKMQDAYITQVLNSTDQPQVTLVAEIDNETVGLIHACSHHDSISNELCATIPLLVVSKSAARCGVGSALMTAAEEWAKVQNYRLLHLEVFANNDKAQTFYQRFGFKVETLHMIKTL